MFKRKIYFQKIHKITNICWDKCVDHADSYLTRSQESCLQYCTDRYTDTTVLLTQRFNQRLGGGAGH